MRSRSRTTSRGNRLSVYELIGRGYENVWWTNCHCRYRAMKGARNTKKSYDFIGWETLDKIFSDPRRNILMLRETQKAHRTSTWPTIKRIISNPIPDDPSVSFSRFFKFNESSLIMTYKPTGQQIIFLGCDDPHKIKSIQVAQGYLTDVYVEEAFQIDDFDYWREIDGSIRGKLPNGLFHQITFLFNATSQNHWLYPWAFKGRLEDDPEYLETHDHAEWMDERMIIGFGRGLALHTSTFRINEFRDTETYDPAMAALKASSPELYKVDALGCWGNSQDATYPEWNDKLILADHEANNLRYSRYAIGIDTGLSDGQGKIKTGDGVRIRSATTMQLSGLTDDRSRLVAIDEYYHSNDGDFEKKTEPQLYVEIVAKIKEWRDVKYRDHPNLMKGLILVYVDCADKGFADGLRDEAMRQGLYGVAFQGSTKRRIRERVDHERHLMAYGEFLASRACPNLIRELRNSRVGQKGEAREDFDDHAINANEYSWAPFISEHKRYLALKHD